MTPREAPTGAESIRDADPLPILYRDERLVIVDKPSGLLVHRSPIDRHETRFAVQLLRDQGVPIALATDCNPGTSPLLSPTLAINMACTLFGLTPEEALAGMTVNAARALGLASPVAIVWIRSALLSPSVSKTA